MTFDEFLSRWRDSGGAERGNKDSFLNDLCDVLGVPRPNPTTGDSDLDVYAFERDALISHENGKATIGKIDLYKAGSFVLEAKQGSEAGSRKVGSAKRGSSRWNIEMRDAFGQALGYAKTLDDPPPFIITCDIGHCFDLYATFDGTWNYRAFPDALRSRIYLADLEAHAETFRKIFSDPMALDASKHAAKVTREIAGHIANLARALEDEGHEPERVAKFLMRCLFTMFAEDVDLLPKATFANALDVWYEEPERFVPEVEALWSKMNEGGSLPFVGKILQFNGGLFLDPSALSLSKKQIWLLRLAAASDWSKVEPAIFGVLLERALDPKERHALGAHYTPRAYVERLVRPTIEEPLRAEWDLVQAEVRLIVAAAKSDDDRKAMTAARKPVHAFYDRLRELRILDPACGSGNFLFVALDLLKRLENEVYDLLHDLGEEISFNLLLWPVSPKQFLGIEVKAWAKEITELVLWIGYLQWQIRTRGWKTNVPEPVLRDYQNIENRDAVLEWDERVPVLDDEGDPVSRWDGETMKVHPVTGKEIPDESAQLAALRYLDARKAVWPKADFIIGNPPYIGTRRMRLILGDGYVEALAGVYSSVPDNADYVMYWWDKAADAVGSGQAKRFGFITTNSIVQVMNRTVVEHHLQSQPQISIRFAIPDHPWVDSAEGAAVRVAMTVGVRGSSPGVRYTVIDESPTIDGDAEARLSQPVLGHIGPDLRVGASPASAAPLRSNGRIAFWGVKFYGGGFVVESTDRASLDGRALLRPYVSGRDLTNAPRDLSVIDCDGLSEDELAKNYPETYQRLLEAVKPVRIHNPRAFKRERWWIFGENQPGMRAAVLDLDRYIVTTETAKHRVFHFLDHEVLAEGTVAVIAVDELLTFGVVSSRVHVVWALAAGGRLGIGNDPRYNKTRCFDTFPFPDSPEALKHVVEQRARDLDIHRTRQQELHPALTITAMYNVLEKLRANEPLTPKEKITHEEGLISVLKQLHDDLDTSVFDAYGWPRNLSDDEILERLVALNAERAEEEKRGVIRWLRPEFQNPSGRVAEATQREMGMVAEAAASEGKPDALEWPDSTPEQLAALRAFLFSVAGTWTVKQIAKRFVGAKKKEVEQALASLEALGIVVSHGQGDARQWTALRPAPGQRRITPLSV